MNNQTILIKVKQRLNKLASNDYDNIEDWQVIEAFNKGTVEWCRRNLHGLNVKQTGDEQSKRRIDDFQIILVENKIDLIKRDGYFESPLPINYFEWKRISVKGTSDCCKDKRPMVVTLAEEANVDEINRDFLKKPSFDWAETYCTLKNGTVHVHTNNEFELTDAILSYYRQPRRIEILGISNPYGTGLSTVNVESEFKDDIVEVLIDETAKIIAGDIESFNTQQISTQQVEGNN